MAKKKKTQRRKARIARRHPHRRANPGPALMPVLLANPRGRRKARLTVHRKARRHAAPMRASNPRRRRRRHYSAHHQAAPRAVHFRRRRRHSNPGGMMRWQNLVRVGVAGVLGIIVSRISGNLYTTYVSSYVLGTDSKDSMRGWLDDIAHIVACEAGVLIVAKVAAKAGIGTPMDRQAFMIAGTAETARQALGTIVGRMSPSTDRKRFGIDGLGEVMPAGFIDPGTGAVYALTEAGGYALEGVVPRNSLAGVINRAGLNVG